MSHYFGSKKTALHHIQPHITNYDGRYRGFLDLCGGSATVTCAAKGFDRLVFVEPCELLCTLLRFIKEKGKGAIDQLPNVITKDEYDRLKDQRDAPENEDPKKYAAKRAWVAYVFSCFGKAWGGFDASNVKSRIKNWRKLETNDNFKRAELRNCSYADINVAEFTGWLVYADPPYEDCKQKYPYRYPYNLEHPFDHKQFYEKAQRFARNNTVLISEDPGKEKRYPVQVLKSYTLPMARPERPECLYKVVPPESAPPVPFPRESNPSVIFRYFSHPMFLFSNSQGSNWRKKKLDVAMGETEMNAAAAAPPVAAHATADSHGHSPRANGIGEGVVSHGGDGGCTAVALTTIGVWPSVGVAKAALDAQIAPLHERLTSARGGGDETEAGIRGQQWHEAAVGNAVKNAGWHFKKVPLDVGSLEMALSDGGSYLVLGVTNNRWKKPNVKKGAWQVKYPHEPADAPAKDSTGWHHSIAIVNRKVRDFDASHALSVLWLRKKDNRPNRDCAYMRSIRKVYRISKC